MNMPDNNIHDDHFGKKAATPNVLADIYTLKAKRLKCEKDPNLVEMSELIPYYTKG
jgi:hypothetical protein